jgi:hypothetical protein
MTPEEFRKAGERIAGSTPEASTRDWRKGLAQRTKITLEEIDRYARGEAPVPDELASELRRLDAPQPTAGSAPDEPRTPGEAAGQPTLGGVPESNQPIPTGGNPARPGASRKG